MRKTLLALLALCLVQTAWARRWTVDDVKSAVAKVNNYWQANNPAAVRSFWDNAAYHTGNIEAYRLVGNEQWLDYSKQWATHNLWMGAQEKDPAKWLYKKYGESQQHVLFGDWQICFQTYIDIYNIEKAKGNTADLEYMTARAREVMGYMARSSAHDYWWWADALYMVMPVMTKMYRLTGDRIYLDKLYANTLYADSIMLDAETGLYFRDGKYVWPMHKTTHGKKDFWARGDGWVLAGLAKVLADLPADDPHRDFFVHKFQRLAAAVAPLQRKGGYWSRSLMDEQQAPGPETSGTAFFTYGLLWGINHGYLPAKPYRKTIDRAWKYLTQTALQPSGRVGYVQPIGEKAIPGQVVDQNSQANFGVGAFLLAACEYARYLEK
jgi:rhamnogalacturonyl hydrolase YesR